MYRTLIHSSLFILLCVYLSACSSNGGTTSTISNVNKYLTNLPSWTEYSPPQESKEAAPTGDNPVIEDPVTISTPAKDEDGEIQRDETTGEPLEYQDVTYTCSSTPYSLTSNPEKIVMYNPDASILWPGSLIQGKSYANGVGSLLGLTIAERAPIQVAITDFFNDNPAQFVENPSLVTVTAAIGNMVGGAQAEGLDTPSSIQFNMETYHSDTEFAAAFSISGNYLGFSGSASGEKNSNASETTVAVHFYQQMFTVSVAPPQTPGAFFSDDFTAEKLQEQVDLNKMGPDNLPVYLSEVVYGRMMMFTMTSNASEDEIRGTINAAYNGIGGSAEGSLSASQKEILESSKIAITSYGGPADATIAMIRSGDWSQYFTKTAALTTAKPLSYVFRNLGDGSIAKVSEAGTYNIRECAAKIAAPGTFDFALVQRTDGMPIETPYTSYAGDFNGDNHDDLLFNHKGNNNEIMLAFGNETGGFDIINPGTDEALYYATHPEKAAGGWSNYTTHIIDINADDKDDIIWNIHVTGRNETYAAISQTDATGNTSFMFTAISEHPNSSGSGWEKYDALSADVNGDDRMDLIWNIHDNCCVNRTYVGLSNGDGSFEYLAYQDSLGPSGYNYMVFAGNINGDTYADLIWNYDGVTYTALGDAQGTFKNNGSHTHFGSGYVPYAANINNDVLTDLVFIGFTYDRGDVDVAYASSDGSFMNTSRQSLPFEEGVDRVRAFYTPYFADVNGDGQDDLIYTGYGLNEVERNDNIKSIFTALGTNDKFEPFDTSRVKQKHPQLLNWPTYNTVMGDVNGDKLEDIIWIFEGSTNRIFVGLAKNE